MFTPGERGLTYENIALTTADGLKLRGWYIPSHNRAAVIALHGYGSNRLGAMPYAEMLAGHGYGVLLYDQRASGESEGAVLSWGWRDVGDVASALDFLKSRSYLLPPRWDHRLFDGGRDCPRRSSAVRRGEAVAATTYRRICRHPSMWKSG